MAETSNRLLRYDLRIAANVLRATFARRQDRGIALAVLVFALAGLHAWAAAHRAAADRTAAIGGVLIGVACARAIGARLRVHAADGPLAADALTGRARRRYAAAVHPGAAALIGAAMTTAAPRTALWAVAGYAAGALIAHGADVLRQPETAPRRRPGALARTVRSRLRQPLTGACAAALPIASLALLAGVLAPGALIAAAGIETALLVLALTMIDDAAVRFMAIAGHGIGRTARHHMRAAVPFVAATAIGAAAVAGPAAAAAVAATGIAGLLLMMLRVLLYRLHTRRTADLVLAGIAGLTGFVAIALPVLAPVLLALIAWRIGRRSARRTWLLA